VEFADLGWRLWLHGLAVGYAPESVVFGSAWERASGDDEEAQRRFGSLSMLYKNDDDEQRGSALAAAMLAANRTSVGQAAVARFSAAMTQLATARELVQRERTVADAELTWLFRIALAADEGDTELTAIREGLHVASAFQQRHRVAIVTPDVLRAQMAGPAIRAWHMAIALSHEHDVRLATTAQCDVGHDDFPVSHVSDAELHSLEGWCDVLVFQGHVLDQHPWLKHSKKILVADIYDPFHLEVLEQSRDLHDGERRHTARITVEVLNEQLARGDFFLCASEKQRDFWIGQLAGVGRVNPAVYDASENLEDLISVVPFGVSNEAPSHTRPVLKGVEPGIGPDDKVVLWGGGVYNWFDPLTLVKAIDRVRVRVPEVRLFFMGMRHPNPNVPAMRMAYETQRLAEDLGLVGTHVFFNEGWVDYDDRQNYLLESDIGVSTHLDHVETAFSFRTRILDYLWASLPIVATGGDSFAAIIEREGLGGHRGRAALEPRARADAAVLPRTAPCGRPRRSAPARPDRRPDGAGHVGPARVEAHGAGLHGPHPPG
jgi:glycosyltransferase involved in cell wall biosynthesis